MTATMNRSLGHGVRVLRGEGDGLVVLSENVDLGWRVRLESRPGSAVVVEGTGFEVVDRQPWGRGARWVLEPWSREDVMRVVAPLDENAVEAIAEAARNATRKAELKPALWLLAPALGFAAAGWQRSWRDEWDFPAATATTVSAILEIVVGAASLIEFFAAMGAGASVFPWMPRPLVYVGLYLFVEGLFRLAQVFADGEPVGSLFGSTVSVFKRTGSPAPEPIAAPTVEVFDADTGVLELVSPILRRDWEHPGLLSYRGELYALDASRRLGESWVYAFARVEIADGPSGPRLRLLPPRSEVEPRSFADQPGIVKTVLLTIACTLAPGRYQERWAWELGIRARWFTVIGAAAELVGGLSNLSGGSGAPPATVLLNLFFIFEAMTRFGWVMIRGQPLGSVFGLVLTPVLEHWLPEPQPLSGQDSSP